MSGAPAPLDPEIAAALAALPLELPELGAGNLAEQRGVMDALFVDAEPPEGVRREEHVTEGESAVVLRVHRPERPATRPRACVYGIHGGGLVLGSNRSTDAELGGWCARFDCVTVSPAYRLAPEHPYPAALDDCAAGLRWVLDNADAIGVDRERIGVAGSSAGGGLAAALALRVRDAGEVDIAFQLLLAPMLDDRQQTPSSLWPASTWSPASNRFGWMSYLGDLDGGDVPADAAPARAVDLSGLPPTFVRVGACDGFVDECVAYAQRLVQAGVPTELHVYPSVPHGFETLAPASAVALRARRDVEDWLRPLLASAGSAG